MENTLPKKPSIVAPTSPVITWVITGAGCLIVMAGGIYLGLGAGKRLTPIISDKLPIPTYSISQPMPTTSEARPSESLIPAPTETPIITVATTPPPDSADEGTYILDFSDTRAVNRDDLTSLTPQELKIARNEIYARHGRTFVHKDLSCYFAKQPWYSVDSDYSDSNLSDLEVKNAATILNYEKSIASHLVAKDSGCNNL